MNLQINIICYKIDNQLMTTAFGVVFKTRVSALLLLRRIMYPAASNRWGHIP